MIAATASWVSFSFIQISSYAAKALIVPMSTSSYVMGYFVDDRSLHRPSIALECQLSRELDYARSVSQESVSG